MPKQKSGNPYLWKVSIHLFRCCEDSQEHFGWIESVYDIGDLVIETLGNNVNHLRSCWGSRSFGAKNNDPLEVFVFIDLFERTLLAWVRRRRQTAEVGKKTLFMGEMLQ